MQLLLHDSLAPLTTSMAFFESPAERTAQTLLELLIQAEKEERRGVKVVCQSVKGDLEATLSTLLPLTTHEIRRHLVVRTRSTWSAYFNNAWLRGPGSIHAVLPRHLNCQAITIRAQPGNLATLPDNRTGGAYGICEMGIYGPDLIEGNFMNQIRLIRVLGDDDRLVFFTAGEVQPFENQVYYQAGKAADRFTFEMLQEYCEVFGLSPFDEDFYRPQSAFLIEKRGRAHPGMKAFTLQDAWNAFDPARLSG